MGRKFKNSDDVTYFSDKSIEQKLEKLRFELIAGYSGKKNHNNNNNNNYRKNKKSGHKKLF